MFKTIGSGRVCFERQLSAPFGIAEYNGGGGGGGGGVRYSEWIYLLRIVCRNNKRALYVKGCRIRINSI